MVASWLGMQAVHEFGHVLGAWLTGGRVSQVVLNPMTISRTDLAVNPSPFFVVWAGPVFGVLMPLLMWGVAAALRMPGSFVLRFFAGFCLLANGLYIGVGSFDLVGDCGVMLLHGSAREHLWLFGALTAPLGLWLWNGRGRNFGFGKAEGEVSRPVTYVMVFVCIGLLLLGFAVGGE